MDVSSYCLIVCIVRKSMRSRCIKFCFLSSPSCFTLSYRSSFYVSSFSVTLYLIVNRVGLKEKKRAVQNHIHIFPNHTITQYQFSQDHSLLWTTRWLQSTERGNSFCKFVGGSRWQCSGTDCQIKGMDLTRQGIILHQLGGCSYSN